VGVVTVTGQVICTTDVHFNANRYVLSSKLALKKEPVPQYFSTCYSVVHHDVKCGNLEVFSQKFPKYTILLFKQTNVTFSALCLLSRKPKNGNFDHGIMGNGTSRILIFQFFILFQHTKSRYAQRDN
jgi:hypothetical protein